jgi:hypothetical protein
MPDEEPSDSLVIGSGCFSETLDPPISKQANYKLLNIINLQQNYSSAQKQKSPLNVSGLCAGFKLNYFFSSGLAAGVSAGAASTGASGA